ncbi:27356_t:CDS:2 [Dentiscutata erythropus]|uniref:27356_t:CDS:1 n=1 Tax=Dentiscutata erythropus TaxID=1348616 RepID=A0A9N9NT72_9GLOM|nr:27356_t:CDS:2 [Dentiscutata erythropus]
MSLSPAASSASSPGDADEHLVCLWSKCYRTFEDADSLYAHLSTHHVGRKSTGNLCLDCLWEDCDVSTTKRDHITSHLRIHVPLKPHRCETCKKAFKRPQDLKKHHKIHWESHREQLNKMKHHRIIKKILCPPTPPYHHPYPPNPLIRVGHKNHPCSSYHPKLSNAPPVNHLEPPSNLAYKMKPYEKTYQPDTISAYNSNSTNLLEIWKDKKTSERLPPLSSIIDPMLPFPSKTIF